MSGIRNPHTPITSLVSAMTCTRRSAGTGTLLANEAGPAKPGSPLP